MGGHANVSFQNLGAIAEQVRAGKLKALAVTGERRAAALPDVPTIAEAGVRELEVYSWQAVAAPKGLPTDVKDLGDIVYTDLNQKPDALKQK